jgi:hypothetical protein
METMTMFEDKRVRIGTDASKWTVAQVVDSRPFKDKLVDMDVRVVPVTDTLFINVRLLCVNGTKEGGDYRLTVSYRGHLKGEKGFTFAVANHPILFPTGAPGVGEHVGQVALDMASGLLAAAVRRQGQGVWMREDGDVVDRVPVQTTKTSARVSAWVEDLPPVKKAGDAAFVESRMKPKAKVIGGDLADVIEAELAGMKGGE